MPREEFLAKKEALERLREERRNRKPKPLASAGKEAVCIPLQHCGGLPCCKSCNF